MLEYATVWYWDFRSRENYFPQEQKQLADANAKLEKIAAQMDELKDEHGGEEGLLFEVIDGDKITKGAVQKRIKEIKGDTNFNDEMAVLRKYAALFDEETQTKGQIKSIEADLEAKVPAKAAKLLDEEMRKLLVEQKWMAAIEGVLRSEIDQLSQKLAGRIKELALRYEEPLPQINDEVKKLSAKVDANLKKMGFTS